MRKIISIITSFALCAVSLLAQENGGLSVGGSGEIGFTNNFYSGNADRYSDPAKYASDRSFGGFGSFAVYIEYDFGHGWEMYSEIGFEQVCISSVGKEDGDSEFEKGFDVGVEEFWIQKSFLPQLNIRAGYILVPVGGLNNADDPLDYFSVYKPEGESTILPSTWNDNGVSVWGEAGAWTYNVMMVAGLDALMFDRDGFVNAAVCAQTIGNYGFAARIDNQSVKGLRLSLSGYAGNSMRKSFPDTQYAGVKGTTLISAFDFLYHSPDNNLIVRGNADYGHVSDASAINAIINNLNNVSSANYPVGEAACAAGLEAGYDFLHFTNKFKSQKLYLFGRYDWYDSYIPEKGQQEYDFTLKHRISLGFNWFPMLEIAVKAEVGERFPGSRYNNEPFISLGIAYQASFRK